jgi:Na+-transporting NADH:ubiquinone oxidoreductase subunit NqrB
MALYHLYNDQSALSVAREMLFNRKLYTIFSQSWWAAVLHRMPSALISSLSLCLLLKTNDWKVAAGAAAVSIFSKFLLRIGHKHIFLNPSALGMHLLFSLQEKPGSVPGQWGSGAIILFTVLSLGFYCYYQSAKIRRQHCFQNLYRINFYSTNLVPGMALDFFIQSITTGSLLLFSFFMISDPRTTTPTTTSYV